MDNWKLFNVASVIYLSLIIIQMASNKLFPINPACRQALPIVNYQLSIRISSDNEEAKHRILTSLYPGGRGFSVQALSL
jgi:hypothetical protein